MYEFLQATKFLVSEKHSVLANHLKEINDDNKRRIYFEAKEAEERYLKLKEDRFYDRATKYYAAMEAKKKAEQAGFVAQPSDPLFNNEMYVAKLDEAAGVPKGIHRSPPITTNFLDLNSTASLPSEPITPRY